jgi:hypothetical protein
MRAEHLPGEVVQQVLSEDAGPGAVQEAPPWGPEQAVGIEQVAVVVIAQGQHPFKVARLAPNPRSVS